MDHKILQPYIAQIIELSDEDLSLLVTCVQSRNLKKGEVLLKEGEVCRAFYLVDKGYLRTYYNKDGVAINLNFTFEGSFTTNLKSYKSKQPSALIIEAGEDASIWVFNIKLLSRQFSVHSQIPKFIRSLAIDLLLASEEHSDLFKIYTPTERYRFIEKNNPQLLQRISLSQMASYLGIARETLSRIRGKNN
jgi:CRP-like cAMP-binding protein